MDRCWHSLNPTHYIQQVSGGRTQSKQMINKDVREGISVGGQILALHGLGMQKPNQVPECLQEASFFTNASLRRRGRFDGIRVMSTSDRKKVKSGCRTCKCVSSVAPDNRCSSLPPTGFERSSVTKAGLSVNDAELLDASVMAMGSGAAAATMLDPNWPVWKTTGLSEPQDLEHGLIQA